MPTVPRRSDDQVPLQGLPSVRFATEAPAGAFGGGPAAQAMEKSIENITGAAKELMVQSAREADNIAVSNAVADLTEQKIRIANSKSRLSGLAAMNAPEEAKEEFNKYYQDLIVGKHREGAAPLNDRQRYLVDQHSREIWTDLFRHTEGHASAEFGRMKTEARDSRQKSYVADSAFNSGNMVKIEGQGGILDKVRASHSDWLREASSDKALPKDKAIFDEMSKERLNTALGQVHEAVIKNLVDNLRDGEAVAYFDRHKDELTGKILEELNSVVGLARVRNEVDKEATLILAKAGSDPSMANSLVNKSKLSGKAKTELQRVVASRYDAAVKAEKDRQEILYLQASQQLSRARQADPFIPLSKAVSPSILGAMNAETVRTIERLGSESGLDSVYADFVEMGDRVGLLSRHEMDAMRVKMAPQYRDDALKRWETLRDAAMNPSSKGKAEGLLTNDELLHNRLAINGMSHLSRRAEKLSNTNKSNLAAIQLTAGKGLEEWQRSNPGKTPTIKDKQEIFDGAIKDVVFKKGYFGYSEVRPEAMTEEDKKIVIVPYETTKSDKRSADLFAALLKSLRGTSPKAAAIGRRGFYSGVSYSPANPPERWSDAELMDDKVVRWRVERAAGYMRANRIFNPEDSGVLAILAGREE